MRDAKEREGKAAVALPRVNAAKGPKPAVLDVRNAGGSQPCLQQMKNIHGEKPISLGSPRAGGRGIAPGKWLCGGSSVSSISINSNS